MTIDLDYLNQKNCQLLENICIQKQSDYSKLIFKIFKIYKSDYNKQELTILHPIFSRDDSLKGLFYQFCKLSLVKVLYKKKIKSFSTSERILANIIKREFSDVTVKINKKDKTNLFTNSFLLIKNIFYLFNLYLAKNKTRRDNIINKKNNITIIETFYSKNLFNKNEFNEQYQSEIYKLCKIPKIKKFIYFYPIILINRPLQKFIFKAKKKLTNQIFCFDFLHFGDYLKAILFSHFFKKDKIKNIFFDKFRVDELIKNFVVQNRNNRSTIISILNYFFFKRLNQNKIRINLIIDWYENQIIDKGFVLGAKKFYNKIKCKGHMGFVTDFETSFRLKPTILEQKLGFVPDEILVCGPKIKETITKNNRSLKIKLVPAIRNQYLYEIKYKNFKKINKKKKILVVFSADHDETFKILRILKDIKDNRLLNNYLIKIRLHRQSPKIKFNDFKIDNDNFINSISKTDIVIATGSTAAIEAYIAGKKVIIIGNNDGLTKNPLRDKIAKNNYRVCYNSNQLLKEIKYFEKIKFKSSNIKKQRQKMLRDFFIKKNKNNIANFYN